MDEKSTEYFFWNRIMGWISFDVLQSCKTWNVISKRLMSGDREGKIDVCDELTNTNTY